MLLATHTHIRIWALNRRLRNLKYLRCCIVRDPGWERIVDVFPGVTELQLQVKTGSRAGRTYSQ